MWLLAVSAAFASAFSAWHARQPPPSPHPEPNYRYAADVWRDAAGVLADRPGVVSAERFGHATSGAPLWVFRVRDPSVPVARRMLVIAQIHALEWVPTEIATEFLAAAARHPPPGVELWIVPVLNPDGRAKVERDLDDGRNAYRRGNGANVDLNRDFAINRDEGEGLTQPESRAVDALAAAQRFDVAVSLHAFGGFVFYPWAGRWKRPEDHAELHALATVASAGMTRHPYRPRQLSRYLFAFHGPGMEIDHLYGRYGTRALLVETTRSGMSATRPKDWFTYFRWYNPREPAPHAREGVSLLRALAWHLVAEARGW